MLQTDPQMTAFLTLLHGGEIRMVPKVHEYGGGWKIIQNPDDYRVVDPKGNLMGREDSLEAAERVLAEVLP